MANQRKSRDLSNLYTYFQKEYGIEEKTLDESIKKLSIGDQELLHKRYGDDLKHPILKTMEPKEYVSLVQQTIRRLTNLVLYGQVNRPRNAQTLQTAKEKQDKETPKYQMTQEKTSECMDSSNHGEKSKMTPEEAEAILNILSDPNFKDLYKDMTMDEVTVFLLKIRNYKTSEIAKNYNISEQDVRDITKSGLIKLKKSLCRAIDEAMEMKLRR